MKKNRNEIKKRAKNGEWKKWMKKINERKNL